jgi:spore coat polysaccharide biosynthesis predicted glycosyltransferase SpsG
MKAVFFTEGGKKIGLGHLTRCIALAQAFTEKRITSTFIICADSSVRDLLLPYQTQYLDWRKNFQNIYEFVHEEDIAVIDSYSADFTIYQQIQHSAKTSIYFDDYNRISYPAGMVINGSLAAPSIPYPPTKNIGYLLGRLYQPMRKSFWSLNAKQTQPSVKNLFLSCGGSDSHHLTPKLIKFLAWHYPAIRIIAVISKSFRHQRTNQPSINDKVQYLFAPSEERLSLAMQNCDLAITAAGQTLYELAASGLPPIVIGEAENQEHNIDSWLNTGFIEFAGWWNDKNLMTSLKRSMDDLVADPVLRDKKSRIGQQEIDGKGSNRIVEKALEYVRKN